MRNFYSTQNERKRQSITSIFFSVSHETHKSLSIFYFGGFDHSSVAFIFFVNSIFHRVRHLNFYSFIHRRSFVDFLSMLFCYSMRELNKYLRWRWVVHVTNGFQTRWEIASVHWCYVFNVNYSMAPIHTIFLVVPFVCFSIGERTSTPGEKKLTLLMRSRICILICD